MAKRADLGAAKAAKKDEFYTQLTDIEKEMRYYRKHFKGKTVFCNCDAPQSPPSRRSAPLSRCR